MCETHQQLYVNINRNICPLLMYMCVCVANMLNTICVKMPRLRMSKRVKKRLQINLSTFVKKNNNNNLFSLRSNNNKKWEYKHILAPLHEYTWIFYCLFVSVYNSFSPFADGGCLNKRDKWTEIQISY